MKTPRRNKDKTALVPGCFDPVTKGHMFLVDHAAKKYGKVYVTVFINKDKNCFFDLDERLTLLRAACAGYDNVEVDADGGMLWQYAQRKEISVSVRGWRDERDLAYEKEMAAYNSSALSSLRTELIRCPKALRQISSTCVRRALQSGEDVFDAVPGETVSLLRTFMKKRSEQ